MSTTPVAQLPRQNVRRAGLSHEGLTSVDLIQTFLGHIYRTYTIGSAVQVDRSVDAGATWEEVTAATDGGGFPTLTLDNRDWLWVWYHAGGTCYAKMSGDTGLTWEDWAEHAGITHPRAVWWQGRLLLAGCAGGAINLYESPDWGQTLTLASEIATAPEQVPALRMDARGWLHVVYRDAAGNLLHAASGDGEEWTDPDTLAAGQYPVLSIGAVGRLLSYWDGEGLQAAELDAVCAAVTDTHAGPETLTRGYCGALVAARQTRYIAGKAAGVPATRWSDDGEEWAEPI